LTTKLHEPLLKRVFVRSRAGLLRATQRAHARGPRALVRPSRVVKHGKEPSEKPTSSMVGLSRLSSISGKPNFNIKMRLIGYQSRHDIAILRAERPEIDFVTD
jgi:hypothetical protein